MVKRNSITISLDIDVIEKIDNKRDLVPRSRYIERILLENWRRV